MMIPMTLGKKLALALKLCRAAFREIHERCPGPLTQLQQKASDCTREALTEFELEQDRQELDIVASPPAVMVFVKGGVVQSAISEHPHQQILIVDYDIEGCDLTDLKGIPQSDSTFEPATVEWLIAAYDPERATMIRSLAERRH